MQRKIEVLVRAIIQSREDHLEFFWKNKQELTKEKVLPTALAKAVLKLLKDKTPFWVGQI